MQIRYRTKKLEKFCTVAIEARKEYGLDIAEKLQQRVGELVAADSIDILVRGRIGNCHPLHGDRQGQYAMDLSQPFRLIIKKFDAQANVVIIVEVEDYH